LVVDKYYFVALVAQLDAKHQSHSIICSLESDLGRFGGRAFFFLRGSNAAGLLGLRVQIPP
jgi:hypothetical protein